MPGTTPAAAFPAVWLRHNCPCPGCQDPVTGQRLIEITAIPNGPGATVTAEDGDTIEVTFTPDGHRATVIRGRSAWRREARGSGTGTGCYADLDGLLSTLAVLRRSPSARTIGAGPFLT